MTPQFPNAVERWPLERLIPHARNARTHSDEQVAQIAGSIAEFGFVNPVLVGDDGVMVAGHGRVLAARKLGLTDAPVIVLSHLTPTQRRALMIADNRIAENAGWDDEIDDYGTGYSSLDYLRSFRFSRLKIDRRFITDVTTNRDDATIVRATIGLAHELGIEVVAEGVETAGQRDFLIAAGCKVAQGYYFGKPVPAAAASELLRGKLQIAAI